MYVRTQTSLTQRIQMKNQIAKAAVLISLLLQYGCSAQSEEKKIQKLNSVENYSDLADLESEDFAPMAKIREMEESEDPKLDREDKVEIMSAKDKILIVGDSWGTFPCLYNSMGKMINDTDIKIFPLSNKKILPKHR